MRRDATVAQHGAAVGERHDLIEPVRDIDDGDALLLHAPEHREQLLDFVGFERRGRLVEDQQPAAPAHRLGDGDKLALRKRQAVHAGVGVRREIELRQGRACLLPHGLAVDDGYAQQPPDRRVVERQVLGNRQRGNEAQLLRNGDDAGDDRVMRTAEAARAASRR